MATRQDRRTARTRSALIEAFNHLVLHRRPKKIRVSDIIAKANVGRSTFYEHYASADDIHMEALSRVFGILADAAAGIGDPHALDRLLAHFWQNRQRARESLDGRMGDRVARMLADLVEERLIARRIAPAIPMRLAALQLAQSSLGPIRGWLLAEAPCTTERLARSLCRTGEQLVAALAPVTAAEPEIE